MTTSSIPFPLIFLLLFSCTDENKDGAIVTSTIVPEEGAIVEVETEYRLLELNTMNSEFYPAKINSRNSRIVVNRDTISSRVFDKLEGILVDSNSYNQATSACFHPNIGLQKVNDVNDVESEYYVCMSCNNVEFYCEGERCSPLGNNRRYHGLSQSVRSLVRGLLSEYGFNQEFMYSYAWDSKEELIEYNLLMGRDSFYTIFSD